MTSYLCDTNIISEIMKPAPNEAVKEWVQSQFVVYLSVITVEEIVYGLSWRGATRKLHWFNRFVKTRSVVLPITQSIAEKCGELRGNLQSQGITKSQADMFIASTAAIHNMIVVTRNEKDFSQLPIQIFNPF